MSRLARQRADHDTFDQDLALRRIEDESRRMGTLVEDLLTLARLDQTRPPERQLVDLSIVAADACTDGQATAPDRSFVLDASATASVLGDVGQLRQAVSNLVANALRHTPTGTEITVGVKSVGDTWQVTVADRGPGLAPEALAQAFDRFWQADRARHGHGAGLGLSIVAAIAKEHRGSIAVANRPGGGAVFTLIIPAMNRDGQAAAAVALSIADCSDTA